LLFDELLTSHTYIISSFISKSKLLGFISITRFFKELHYVKTEKQQMFNRTQLFTYACVAVFCTQSSHLSMQAQGKEIPVQQRGEKTLHSEPKLELK
jgi:hypothetical protein